MTDDIAELKQAYRDIKAPPHLATRIRAEAEGQRVRSHSWMPAGATVMAIVLVAWLAPFDGEQTRSPSVVPSKPSLSAIAALKPNAPRGTSVSLSKLKTVKKPKLPSKPRFKATKPQTNLEPESDLSEEKNYVFS
ncbi:MAG: hypothetical protein ACR2RD_01925 [Woeseiaceae bacterium]